MDLYFLLCGLVLLFLSGLPFDIEIEQLYFLTKRAKKQVFPLMLNEKCLSVPTKMLWMLLSLFSSYHHYFWYIFAVFIRKFNDVQMVLIQSFLCCFVQKYKLRVVLLLTPLSFSEYSLVLYNSIEHAAPFSIPSI